MMLIAVFAKEGRYSADYVANYSNVYILDALKRVPGAGQAQVLGVPDQAMRIWMNPDRMMLPWILMLMGEPAEMKMSEAFFSAISCRSFSMNIVCLVGVLSPLSRRAGAR